MSNTRVVRSCTVEYEYPVEREGCRTRWPMDKRENIKVENEEEALLFADPGRFQRLRGIPRSARPTRVMFKETKGRFGDIDYFQRFVQIWPTGTNTVREEESLSV